MNKPGSIGLRGVRPAVLGLIALLLALLAPPRAAWAHPLDEYLQATYISVEPERVLLELDLTPGLLVAPQVVAQIDTNGDGQLSEAEGTTYAQTVLRDIVVSVDGRALLPTLTTSQFPPLLNLNAGVGTIRLDAVIDVDAITPGDHILVVQNDHQPAKSAYQATTLLPKSDDIKIERQARDEELRSITIDYAYALATSTTDTSSTAATATSANPQQQQLLNALSNPTLTLPLLALAFGLAVVLGGLHALTPGHGKTLVAAYLVGSRGTVRHAVLLGSVTTFTHTISVVIVGVLALVAQQFIVSSLLVPLLEISSGALVVLMGAQLVLRRWRTLRTSDADAHDHGFGPHTHALGDLSHRPISRTSLLAMGVSSGLVPCPEALGIMLVAVGLNRAGLGLGLVVAFSLGLAAVLILMGVVLVRSKSLVERLSGAGQFGMRMQRVLPLAGAIVVTVLGAGLVIKGVTATMSGVG